MAFLHNSTTNQHVWETISIEIEGPFTKTSSGNQYLVVLTDLYSKWVEAKAFSEKLPTDVASFILSTFSRMGFCDCKFFNMEGGFEREIRLMIHKLGSPFVQNVEKFKAVLDRVIENVNEADHSPSEIRQFGYHTEKITSFISENLENWDINLEGFLFKLRMGDESDAQAVSASPFSIIYGKNNSESNDAGNINSEIVKRGRGRPPRKHKLIKSTANYYEDKDFVPTSVDQNRYKPIKDEKNINELGAISNEGTGYKKRGRGRPKSDKNSITEESSESENQMPLDKKYKLTTRLKAKYKTNAVTQMLKRSAQKRSLPFDLVPNTIFVSVDENFKHKEKSVGIDESKLVLSSTVGAENGANQIQFGEASIVNAAGEVSVIKLNYVKPMVSEIDEQSVAMLSIPDTNEQGEIENNDDDCGDDAIENLEEEDDIEQEDEEENYGDVDPEIGGEVRIQCSNCSDLYLNEKESLLHAQFHRDGSKLLHCIYCTDVTGTWENMQNHLIAHIDNNNAPGAATMLKKLRGSRAAAITIRKLRRKELAGRAPIRCTLCPAVRMATPIEEAVHQSCHREDGQLLRCPNCDHVCGNWPQMQVHLSTHPDFSLESYVVPIEERTCPKCEKVFPTSEMVVEHQNLFHFEINKFQCEVCEKSFKERKSMARHKQLHADITYRCGNCNYTTKIHQNFVDHQGIHQGLGFKCNLCEKVFVKQRHLHAHQEVHNKKQFLIILCDQCGYEARGMTAMRNHNRDAHGISQAFPCPQCSYIGPTKSNLKGHTDRIHNKQFKCTQCSFETLTESTLLRHIDIYHNLERTHVCEKCPYRARDSRCLTEHMRVVHNPNMQKFPCDFCKLEFKTKSMLRDHLPQHTGQRFTCKLCDCKKVQYRNRSTLYRHVISRHPGHTLASVMEITEPTVTVTPDGKPILKLRTRARPPRNSLQSSDDISPHLGSIITSITSSAEDMESDPESQTTTSDNGHMLDPTFELMKDRANGVSGNMYIAVDEAGTFTVGENDILLDANILAQAAAGGEHITFDDNMCLQIFQKNEVGDDVVMQVIPHIPNDGGETDKSVKQFFLIAK